MYWLCFFLLLAATLSATAQIYRYADAHGNTAYSDQPPVGVTPRVVEPAAINRLPAPPSRIPATAQSPSAPDTADYTVLRLTGEPESGVVRANDGTFSVQVLVQPPLQRAHRLRLLLDDKPYGQAITDPSLPLHNIDRGEHRLAVQVLEGEQVLQQSPPLYFTLQRIHR